MEEKIPTTAHPLVTIIDGISKLDGADEHTGTRVRGGAKEGSQLPKGNQHSGSLCPARVQKVRTTISDTVIREVYASPLLASVQQIS